MRIHFEPMQIDSQCFQHTQMLDTSRDVWFKIFSYLSLEHLKSTLFVSRNFKFFTIESLKNYLKTNSRLHLKGLFLWKQALEINQKKPSRFSELCPNLKELEIDDWSLPWDKFRGDQFPNVRVLNLTSSREIFGQVFPTLASLMPNLEEIAINYSGLSLAKSFFIFSVECQWIKKIIFNDATVSFVTKPFLENPIFPLLETIHLNKCNLSIEAFIAFASKQPNLKKIILDSRAFFQAFQNKLQIEMELTDADTTLFRSIARNPFFGENARA